MKNKILFQEKQKFTQWWLWLLLIGLFCYLLYENYMAYQTGKLDFCAVLFSFGILIPILILFYLLRLLTLVRADGIYVRFYPFHRKWKYYAWEEIEEVKVLTYKPLLDYGGWGIRYGRKGKAYNVKGNQGLQIHFKSGKNLLIGTQKPEELEKGLGFLK